MSPSKMNGHSVDGSIADLNASHVVERFFDKNRA
jgi:hypothetical protein